MGCASSVQVVQAPSEPTNGASFFPGSASGGKWSNRGTKRIRQLLFPSSEHLRDDALSIKVDYSTVPVVPVRDDSNSTAPVLLPNGELWSRAHAADVAASTLPFLPTRVSTAFAQGHLSLACADSLGLPATSPAPRSLAAALLIVDVSGFTKLSEDAQRRLGIEGVERFSLALSAFFAIMMKLIQEHQGDVDCFAGDAVLVVFEPPITSGYGGDGDGALRDATHRGLMCAQAIHFSLDGFRNDPEDPPLSMHSALAAGTSRLSIRSLIAFTSRYCQLHVCRDLRGRPTIESRTYEARLVSIPVWRSMAIAAANAQVKR
jgi:class 3 adenylate cyclase